MEFKLLEGGKIESQSKKWDCPSDEAAKPEASKYDPPYPKATKRWAKSGIWQPFVSKGEVPYEWEVLVWHINNTQPAKFRETRSCLN